MTLNDVYLISQIIASVAVVATLVALVVSLRQNTKAQRLASVQSITAAIAAINVPAMESPALGRALAATQRDWAAATRDERVVAHYFCFAFFKLCEQAWVQYKAGALDEDQWAGWEMSLLRLYHSPGIQAVWWPARHYAYSKAFQEYLAKSHLPDWVTQPTQYDIFDGAPTVKGSAEALKTD
jgi:hypothetical protein